MHYWLFFFKISTMCYREIIFLHIYHRRRSILQEWLGVSSNSGPVGSLGVGTEASIGPDGPISECLIPTDSERW